jgi:hypothetical protein
MAGAAWWPRWVCARFAPNRLVMPEEIAFAYSEVMKTSVHIAARAVFERQRTACAARSAPTTRDDRFSPIMESVIASG